MKTKVEIVEYSNGQYAVKKTTGIIFKTVSFANFDNGAEYHGRDNAWMGRCFTRSLKEAEDAFVKSGRAPAVKSSTTRVLSLMEMSEMTELADTNEGMRDLLLKAKEFYILLKK